MNIMLYHVIYRVWYYPRLHITAVGLGTYYPQIWGSACTYFLVKLCLYRSHLDNQKIRAEHLWLFEWICQSEMDTSIFTSCGKLKNAHRAVVCCNLWLTSQTINTFSQEKFHMPQRNGGCLNSVADNISRWYC